MHIGLRYHRLPYIIFFKRSFGIVQIHLAVLDIYNIPRLTDNSLYIVQTLIIREFKYDDIPALRFLVEALCDDALVLADSLALVEALCEADL